MTMLLHLQCSPRGAAAFSSQLAQEVVARWGARHPGTEVRFRDLAAAPPRFVDAAFSAAILRPAGESAGEVPDGLAESEGLIRELEAADAVVVATPMHNFGVPAVLKAWVDQIVRIHRSFASTPGGKVGMLVDRPVWLVVASGGWFTGPTPTGAAAQPDFLVPYLRAVLNTIGIFDLRVLTLEGAARGPDVLAAGLAKARAELDRMLPALG